MAKAKGQRAPVSSETSGAPATDTRPLAAPPVVVAVPGEAERGALGGQLNVRLLDVYARSIRLRADREDVSYGEVVEYALSALRTLEVAARDWTDEQVLAYVRGLQRAATPGDAVSRWAKLWRTRLPGRQPGPRKRV